MDNKKEKLNENEDQNALAVTNPPFGSIHSQDNAEDSDGQSSDFKNFNNEKSEDLKQKNTKNLRDSEGK